MLDTTASRLLSPDEVAEVEFSEIIDEGFRVWRRLKAGRPFPERADLGPLELRRVTAHIMLWDILDAPKGEDFVVLIAGEKASRDGGGRLRGTTLLGFHGDGYEVPWREYDAVRRTGWLHYCRRRANWAGKSYLNYRRLLMPLGRDGVVTNLISVVDFESPQALSPTACLM